MLTKSVSNHLITYVSSSIINRIGIDDKSKDAVFVTTNKTRPLWTNDDPKGEGDTNHSMKHLIDWLTTDDNWIRYKGKNNSGKSKTQWTFFFNSFHLFIVRITILSLVLFYLIQLSSVVDQWIRCFIE